MEEGGYGSDDFGPAPAEAEGDGAPDVKGPRRKRVKREAPLDAVYLEGLPRALMYEKSYMHRDTVTHVCVTGPTDFLCTASIDGHVKFWKKMPQDIEFVKHYHAHLGPIHALVASIDGQKVVSTSADKNIKFYDVLSFDMSNMVNVEFVPTAGVWVGPHLSPQTKVCVCDQDSPAIRIFECEGSPEPIRTINIHSLPVLCLAFHHVAGTVISVCAGGVIEYWGWETGELPRETVDFSYKSQTDLYLLAMKKTRPCAVSVNVNEDHFAVTSLDKQVRVFGYRRGKLKRQYDESDAVYESADANGTLGIDSIDFGRRRAVEAELMSTADSFENTNAYFNPKFYFNAIFDESGRYLIYTTMLGVKIICLNSNKVVRLLGKIENTCRFISLCLYQGIPVVDTQFLLQRDTGKTKLAEELNKAATPDPTIICTAFKSRRFYLFSTREPTEYSMDEVTSGESRDVFNEVPTAEERTQVPQAVAELAKEAIIRTTLGDIHVKLFAEECPRTVENFTVHSKNGYYDNLRFHRVMKGFMIQTGDPEGDGTGGESIWGGEFEDEIRRNLRHDRPYTLSMANSGPNTNGSQFFITTVPTPWLDGKHTVFGRVIKGFETVADIENLKTNNNDRPYDEVKMVGIDIIT